MVLYIEKFMKEGTGVDLNWLESLIYGLISGITEILPVSARAHSILVLKLFGAHGREDIREFLIHGAVIGAIYLSSRKQIVKMTRAKALARIPKRRRKRPLDERSLMDFSFLATMAVPAMLAVIFYGKLDGLNRMLLLLSGLMFLNGIILYIPQFFPSSNKDSRSLSRLEGILMGLGGAFCIVPGFSGVGAALSVGSVCGVERSYALNMTLLMEMAVSAAIMVFHVVSAVTGGIDMFTFGLLLQYILSAGAAFLGAYLAIKLMRMLAANSGFSGFAYYCWGVALFSFILNLMA